LKNELVHFAKTQRFREDYFLNGNNICHMLR